MTDSVAIPVAFGPSRVETAADGAMRVLVPTDGERGDVALHARLHRPGVIRDALLAMGDVLSSDLTRKPTDRADYLQYLISRGKGVSKQVWDAQKEYLALQYSAAAKSAEPLDPVLSIAGDAVRLEVMSRDESSYAQLALRRPAALVDAQHPGDVGSARGTTYVDLAAAISGLGRIRSYRATTLELAPVAGEPGAARTKQVPLRWLRAFGQMQAASLIAADRFELAPIDLYNVLLALRLRKARTAPRGLRYELVPGEPPRLVLEPWDLVVRSTGAPYAGAQPRVIRTWGRNRLNALARILPHARSLTVAVAGPGLPSLYTADLGDATLSLALSGWTDASWAGIATFDLLAADDAQAQPAGEARGVTSVAPVDAVVAALAEPLSLDALAAKLGRPVVDVRRTVLAGLSQLRIGHDLATGALFARPLTKAPIPPASLAFRDAREAAAHRLLGETGSVTLTKVHDQGSDGRSIEGQVVDAKAHRTFYPSFTIDAEQRTSAATCTCSAVRRSGVKEGPCEHMIALRVQYARELARLEAARATPEGRAQITAETRVLMRRTSAGAETYRLSLDGRTVTSRFTEPPRDRASKASSSSASSSASASASASASGSASASASGSTSSSASASVAASTSDVVPSQRMQRLRFDSLEDARAAYFARLTALAQKGYLDATQD